MRILRCRLHLKAASKLPQTLRWDAACPRKLTARFQSAALAGPNPPPHTPVLLQQVLSVFQDTELKVHVDCTLGAGGHAEAIINDHPELEHFVGIDQDATALEIAQKRLEQFSTRGVQLHYINSNFRPLLQHVHELIEQENIPHAPDGILMDLGVSSMQLDRAERGFSFMKEGPLDMRMDPRSSATAETLVNELSEQELGKIIREYGEERMWRTVAGRIVDARGQERITTTTQLASIIGRTRMSRKGSKKRSATSRGPHPATRTFQALRIAVNGELQVIEEVVPQAIEALRPGGRLAVISFHSLEDKIVKWGMRGAAGEGKMNAEQGGMSGSEMEMLRARGLDASELDAGTQDKVVRLIGRKAMTATDQEVEENARARSAKLRVVEKL